MPIRPVRKALPRRLRRLRVLIVGCGDVGLRLLGQFAHRARFIATARRSPQADAIRSRGAQPLRIDLDDKTRRRHRRAFAPLASRILWLAPPDTTAVNDSRLANGLATLGRSPWPRHTRLVYCGTTGVWGDAQGRLLDETSPINPQSLRAMRRAAAEKQVRHAITRRGWRLSASLLRVPGIYAGDRLPLARLNAGLPALDARHDAWSNHIHADDLANALWLSLWRGANARNYIVSDGQQLRMGDYFDAVADHFSLPRPPRLTPEAVQAIVSAAMWSFMRESRRLSNRRLCEELRVRLRYPTVASTLATVPVVADAEPAGEV